MDLKGLIQAKQNELWNATIPAPLPREKQLYLQAIGVVSTLLHATDPRQIMTEEVSREWTVRAYGIKHCLFSPFSQKVNLTYPELRESCDSLVSFVQVDELDLIIQHASNYVLKHHHNQTIGQEHGLLLAINMFLGIAQGERAVYDARIRASKLMDQKEDKEMMRLLAKMVGVLGVMLVGSYYLQSWLVDTYRGGFFQALLQHMGSTLPHHFNITEGME